MSQKAEASTEFDRWLSAGSKRLMLDWRLVGPFLKSAALRRLAPWRWTDAAIYRTIQVRTPEIACYQDVRQWNHAHLISYDEDTGVDSKRFVLANAGKVLGGDWDLVRVPFEESDIYRMLHEHFVDGVPWEQTAVFRRFEYDIRNGRKRWKRSRSRQELLRAAERCDRLFECISNRGYECRRRQGPIPFADEITVSIGRHGEILFNNVGGRHRLSIAKILGIEYVPVRVLLRHSHWQALRDRLRGVRSLSQLTPDDRYELRHPDLADLPPAGWLSEAGEPGEGPVGRAA